MCPAACPTSTRQTSEAAETNPSSCSAKSNLSLQSACIPSIRLVLFCAQVKAELRATQFLAASLSLIPQQHGKSHSDSTEMRARVISLYRASIEERLGEAAFCNPLGLPAAIYRSYWMSEKTS